MVVPLTYIFYVSWFEFDPTTIVTTQFTTEYYEQLLLEEFYRSILWYTFKLAVQVCAVCVLLGYPYGYFLAKTTPLRRKIGFMMVFLPLMVGVVVRAYGWALLLGSNGIITATLQVLVGRNVELLGTTNAVVIGLIGVLLPLIVLPVYSSIDDIPTSLDPAARNLGANRLDSFLEVTLPLSLPGLTAGLILTFGWAMSAIVTPQLLGGRSDVTMGMLIYSSGVEGLNWPFASAVGTVLALTTLTLIYMYIKSVGGDGTGSTSSYGATERRILQVTRLLSRVLDAFSLDSKSRSLSRPAELAGQVTYYALLGVTLLVLLAPIVVIVGVSLNPTKQQVFPPTGLSLRWYEAFLASDQFFRAFFITSIPIALATAVVSTALGVLVAYAIVRREVPFEDELFMYFILPLVVPPALLGLGLLVIFNIQALRFVPRFVSITAGHTVITFPFTFLIALTAIQSVDTDMENAARNLGASKFQTFRKVTFPLMRSGIVSGFLLAFILSFSDTNVALFLAGGDTVTVPIAIFQYVTFTTSPLVASTATLQILLILLLVAFIGRYYGFETVVTET
jgi:ABC-type spermidine/putrescine transport system permease subunit I